MHSRVQPKLVNNIFLLAALGETVADKARSCSWTGAGSGFTVWFGGQQASEGCRVLVAGHEVEALSSS